MQWCVCPFCGEGKFVQNNKIPKDHPWHHKGCHGEYLRWYNKKYGYKQDVSTYRKICDLAKQYQSLKVG